MHEWNKTLPRSLFSLLGSGRSPELYPVYLEVLLRLYEHGLQYAALGLEREQAKQLAEQAFSESGLSSLPTDEFADSEYESVVESRRTSN